MVKAIESEFFSKTLVVMLHLPSWYISDLSKYMKQSSSPFLGLSPRMLSADYTWYFSFLDYFNTF